jgi:hypothetical protein
LVGALLFVPYAVGIGYAIGYGLGPYMANLQQKLGGFGHVVLFLAIIAVVVLLAWRTIIRIIRRSVMLVMWTRLRGRARW